MDRDRNLLFGVLAVQLKKITPGQLVEAAGAWATDPSKDLAQRLVEAGMLSGKDRDLLSSFVEDAVKAHGGDTGKTLAAFGGEEQVHQSFRGSIVLTDSGAVQSVAPVQAAEDLIREEGYPAVTARNLAEKLELTRQIVHYYFGLRDELIIATVRDSIPRILPQLRSLLAEVDPDA